MSCGYSRVFDMKNIVDGSDFGLKQTYSTISALKSGQLGNVFVKFGEPISIGNFLASQN
jgi:glycerol-3-phosphate O-acyltransferase